MKIHLYLAVVFLLFSPSALAGSVIKTVGKKVYIKFSKDDSFTEGDLFYITDANGKKRGLVLLKKVKGLKAIGLLQKGKAPNGGLTVFKGLGKKAKAEMASNEESSESEGESSAMPYRPRRWGFLAGYGMAKQDVINQNPSDNTTSKQDGTSISFKGLYDHPWMETITIRGLAGVEIFSVSGPSSVGDVGSDIKYFTLDGLAKWDFSDSKSMTWYLIGGMSVFYPFAKSSTAIEENSINSFLIGEFGAGLEFKMGSYAVPLQVTYYYFPAGKDVKTNVISIKTGMVF